MTMPKFEPTYWQWRRKHDNWAMEYTASYELKATTGDSEVRTLHPDDQLTEAYAAGKRDAPKVNVTLTGKEIRELAEFAGLQIVEHDYADEYETEITVEGPSNLTNDDGMKEHYCLIAYFTEYPEEGAIGLGAMIAAAPKGEE
jgi:hypothetical protein